MTAQLRKVIGNRRKFAVMGPEFFGCINSGSRARIVGNGHGTYLVYPREFGQAKVYKTRKAAIRAFERHCQVAIDYNTKARADVEAAKSGMANPETSMAAALALSDHGLLGV